MSPKTENQTFAVILLTENKVMCDLTAPEFQDEDVAREQIEASRRPNGPVCLHCGETKRVYV